MPGFDPVGSVPVGAIGTTTPGGSAFSPGTGVATFSGTTPDLSGSTALISPVQASQLIREVVMPAGPSDLMYSQLIREVLIPGIPSSATADTVISIIW